MTKHIVTVSAPDIDGSEQLEVMITGKITKEMAANILGALAVSFVKVACAVDGSKKFMNEYDSLIGETLEYFALGRSAGEQFTEISKTHN